MKSHNSRAALTEFGATGSKDGGGGGRGCTEPALTLKGEEREMRWKCPMGLHRGGHLVFRCLGRLDPEGDGKIIDKVFKRKLS